MKRLMIVLLSSCFAILLGVATATAETSSPTGIDVRPGCDGYVPPEMTNVFRGHYWGEDACVQCDNQAALWAEYGYSTWCWDHEAGGAELWVGKLIGREGPVTSSR